MIPLPDLGSPIWLVLCWLAAWRVTALLVYEAGPLDAFSRMRTRLGRAGLGRMLLCFHCTGFWVSAAVVVLVYDIGLVSLVLIPGVAGAVSLAERLSGADFAGRGGEPRE